MVLDEIHRAPGLFDTPRGVIDSRREGRHRNGQFLLLGSAGIDRMRQSAKTLAGRIAYVELPPIDALEAGGEDPRASRLRVRRGFPNSFLARGDRNSLAWREDCIRSYLERDVPMSAPRMPAETVGALAQGLYPG